MAGRFETAANLAIVAACTLIGAQLVIGALRGTQAASSPPGAPALPEAYKPGERLPALKPVDFTRSAQTLVLVVRDGCKYCENSMSFYRTLADAVKGNEQAIQLAVVTPAAPEAGREFLKKHGVDLALVSQSPLGKLKVPGTPTLILTNREGVVSRVWVGQLSDDTQSEVLKALRTAARSS